MSGTREDALLTMSIATSSWSASEQADAIAGRRPCNERRLEG